MFQVQTLQAVTDLKLDILCLQPRTRFKLNLGETFHQEGCQRLHLTLQKPEMWSPSVCHQLGHVNIRLSFWHHIPKKSSKRESLCTWRDLNDLRLIMDHMHVAWQHFSSMLITVSCRVGFFACFLSIRAFSWGVLLEGTPMKLVPFVAIGTLHRIQASGGGHRSQRGGGVWLRVGR